MRSVVRLVAVLMLFSLCCRAVAGPVLIPTSQTRSLEVSAFAVDESQNDLRIDGGVGAFDESLLVHPIRLVEGARYAAHARASQKSPFDDDAFTFSGSIYAQSIHPATSGAAARAVFDVSFDVTQPTDYSLSGVLRKTAGPTDGDLELTLFDGDQVLF